MRLLIILAISFVIVSCETKYPAEYVANRQLLNRNTIGYNGEPLDTLRFIVIKDSISYLYERTQVKIASSDIDYPIKNALYNYNISDSSLIDTISFKVDDNIHSIGVENDTIILWFTLEREGIINFPAPIIPITKGPYDIFRYHDTVKFTYNAVKR